jgi:hypothetical protein
MITIGRPDGVLLFMIHHDFVDSGVFLVVSRHRRHHNLLVDYLDRVGPTALKVV